MGQLTYLDASILIAAANGDEAASGAAFELLADPERAFVVSEYLRIETLANAVYRDDVDEAEMLSTFFNRATVTVSPSPEIADRAYGLAAEFGLKAIDALHVGSAIHAAAADIVTRDKDWLRCVGVAPVRYLEPA